MKAAARTDSRERTRWYARVVRRWPLQLILRYGAGAAVLGLTAGCASPGVPRPPSLHLPALVRDLSALRVGGSVELRFTAPDQTTDHLPLEHKGSPIPLTASLCRVQGASCSQVARLAVVPGQPVSATDTLPPALTVGQGRAVAYRVRVENDAGRDAGLSREALAAAGAAPTAVEGLAVTTVAQGMELTWRAAPGSSGTIRVEAVAQSPAAAVPPAFGKPPRVSTESTRLLQIPPAARDPGGAIDPAPTVGARVTYRVYRQRDVAADGKTLPLRSDSETVSAIRAADVFAPAAPFGLLAVAFTAEDGKGTVSLSWDPNAEPDVAGYYVYRAAGTGPFQRVAPQTITGVSYQDTAATGLRSGTHVRYAVTAVDRAGNESPRSAVTEVEVR